MSSLTTLDVNDLVYTWYKKLDVHAPVEELVPLLASENLEMIFPEATLTTIDGFKGWYKNVTNLFFDEIHNMKMLDIAIDGDKAVVKLIVNWQAKVWNPPAAKSKWLGFDAIQSWIVSKNADGKAVIQQYTVDKLDPMEGSAEL